VLAVGAWAALIALRRDGLRSAIVLGVLCAAALAAVLGGLAALTGYDPVGTLRATESVYRFSIASDRPYAFWLLGSPVAFLVALGIPIAWLALRGLAAGETAAIAIFAVIAIASVAGFTKAETERIWLFLAPMVCLAAAPHLRRPALVAAALGVQAVAFELAFGSQW
jgi:methylthioxylose transferase